MKLSTLQSAFVTAGLAGLGSCGCGQGLPDGVDSLDQTYSATLDSGRTFNYHLPQDYDGNCSKPVYLSFHGAGKTASNQEQLSGLSLPFFNPEGIAVYPDSADDGNYWLSHPGVSEDSPNDIDFTLDVLQWLDVNLCIDNSRLYATGKSNGGGLVNLLACNSTTAAKFAAFASVSGAYYEDKLAINCAPGRPVPYLSFHGLNDTTIPYTGKNPTDPSLYKRTYPIEQWVGDWVKRNGITSDPQNTSGLYDGLVTESTWSRPGFTNLTTFYKENDLGHVWPSTYPNPDCPSPSDSCPLGHYTYNGTSVIMDFFSHWTL